MRLYSRRLSFALLACAAALAGCAASDGLPGGDTPAAGARATPPARQPVLAASKAEADAPGPTSRPSPAAPEVVQRYIDDMRSELSRGKVHLIGHVMDLTAAEAAVFWPIYQDYESELFELGDQRLAALQAFATAQRSKALDAKAATELADRYFTYEDARLALLKKYHGILAKELSPVRAVQFGQIEHRILTVIDLLIASETPLVRQEPDAALSPANAGR